MAVSSSSKRASSISRSRARTAPVETPKTAWTSTKVATSRSRSGRSCVASPVQRVAHERLDQPVDLLEMLETHESGNLLQQDAVDVAVFHLGPEDRAHDASRTLLEGGGVHLGELGEHRVAHVGHVALAEQAQDGLLVREVLVERADADARPRRDAVGGEAGVAVGAQNLSGRLDDGVHRDLRTLLDRSPTWNFAFCGLRAHGKKASLKT